MPLPNEIGDKPPMDMESIKRQIAQLQQGINTLADAIGAQESEPPVEGAAESSEEEPSVDGGGNAGMDALSKFHKQGINRRM